MIKTLATLAVTASLFAVVGCADHKEDMSTTGPNVMPGYEGTHYNPAVNSSGSGIGRTDPAVNMDRGAAATPSGTAAGAGGQMLNGGGSGSSAVGGASGTSDQNGGSSSPSGMGR